MSKNGLSSIFFSKFPSTRCISLQYLLTQICKLKLWSYKIEIMSELVENLLVKYETTGMEIEINFKQMKIYCAD